MNYFKIALCLCITLHIITTWSAAPSKYDFETEFLCLDNFCSCVFSTERECFYHFITTHIPKEIIICPFRQCAYRFTSEHSLSSHLNHAHRIFICNFCRDEIKYNNFDELKIHLREKHMSKKNPTAY